MNKGGIRIVGAAIIAGFAATTFGIREQNWILLAVFEAAAIAIAILGLRDLRREE